MSRRFGINKVVITLIVSALALGALGIGLFLSKSPEAETVFFINNDFHNDVVESIDRFYESGDFADIVSGVDTDRNVLAITFAGMTNPDVMYSVIDIVKKYDIKCTFFLEGAEVAEYSRIVDAIEGTGNEIGSYTLYGNKHINENLTYDVIKDFVYSSALIGREASDRPTYLMCNNSRYTNNLLKAALVSGFDYIVEPTHILNYQSFSTYQTAYDYVRRLPKGSVVAIKMKGVLDAEEYTYPGEKVQSVKKESGITHNDQKILSEEKRLLNVIEWICKSIYITKRNTVLLSAMSDLPPSSPQIAMQGGDQKKGNDTSKQNNNPNTGTPKQNSNPKTSTPKQNKPSNSSVPAVVNENMYDEGLIAQLRREALLNIVEELSIVNAGKVKEPIKLKAPLDKAFNYAFYGVANEASLNDVLSRLENLRANAIFFVAEEDMDKYPDRVNKIVEAGHDIGIALLTKNSTNFTDTAVSLLSAYNTLIKRFGVETTRVLMPFGEINNDIKMAVSTVRMNMIDFDLAVVRSADRLATSADTVIHNVIGDSMSTVKYGSTIYFRLDYYENTDFLVGDLVDKIGSYDSMLIRLAIHREANQKKKAEPINLVYTTEKALSYVFYGVENQTALYDVLQRLDTIGSKGTFFVTRTEIIKNPDCISDIVSRGHEIGIAILPARNEDYFSVGVSLTETSDILSKQYGVNTQLTMMPYGTLVSSIQEAVSSLNLTIIEPTVWIVRNANEFETSKDAVIQTIFSTSSHSMRRGDVVYFRLDFYKNSNTLVADLVQEVKEKFVDTVRYAYDDEGVSSYEIKSLGSLLNNKDGLLYQYPVPNDKMHSKLANAVYPGHFSDMSEDQVFDEMLKRYIGNPDIAAENMLPGFTEEQIVKLDKVGRINTGRDNTVFLTFDDWATDTEINHLLYVLDKHNVKASFFIRTNYVYSNPNLLRAIAAKGHDIGSHTVNHMELTHYDPEEHRYHSINEQEVETLTKELTGSFNTLVKIAGDIKNEKGQPSVQPYFRAPTLAQSYAGMRTVLDCGYHYTISGDFSSGDYDIESVDELKDLLNNGMLLSNGNIRRIEAGSIVVMHISPSAEVTAEAVDLFLTENENKPANKRFSFARLSDYLQ